MREPHRFEVKVQDVVHVGGQRGEQRVVGPVGAHLGDDHGPQGDGHHHLQHWDRPAVTCSLVREETRRINTRRRNLAGDELPVQTCEPSKIQKFVSGFFV